MKIEMKARLIDSTNFIVLTNFKDCEGRFSVRRGMVFIENENADNAYTKIHHTSLIIEWSLEKDVLLVKTLNSIYKYKILVGSPEEITKEFEHMNLALLEELEKGREIKTSHYFVHDINCDIKQITLPYPMDWNEATEFIFKNKLPIKLLKSV